MTSIRREIVIRGPFNNNVDKMRGEGVKKMSVFVHARGIKTVHAGVKKWQNSVHVVMLNDPLKTEIKTSH